MSDFTQDSPFARYELIDRVAVGGMAEVFRAKMYGAHGFEKVIAIKRILPALATSLQFEGRFIAEAKIAVTLNHANIVQILDFSRFRDSLYIAMEYVDGLDLSALLRELDRRGSSLPVEAALFVAIELCKGLAFAHEHGVVHRDISPSNILLSRSGEVKIADFGIARAAADSAVREGARSVGIMGKWPYMSPEQTLGVPLDTRSDLFSAGAVLYETFTGRRLFSGGDADEVAASVRGMEIPSASSRRPDLPPPIDGVLARLLERGLEERFQRAAEVVDALVHISYGLTLHATAMRLAEVVRQMTPAASGPPPVDTDGRAARLIDEILDSEPLRDPAPHGRSRITVQDGPPRPLTEDLPTRAWLPNGGATFVRRARRGDGLTEWQVDPLAADSPGAPNVVAVSPRAAGPRRATIAIAVLALAAAGVLFAVSLRSGPSRATAGDDAGRAAAALALDAAPLESPAVAPDPASVAAARAVDAATELPSDGAPPAAHAGSRSEIGGRQRSRSARATINLYVEPWANVYLDGRKIGVAPQALRLPVGRHRLRLVNPVLDKTRWLTVDVPSSRPYRVSLLDPP